MPGTTLIADSGATKTEWCLLSADAADCFVSQGISPYNLNEEQLVQLLQKEVLVATSKPEQVSSIFYYGTGLANPLNAAMVANALQTCFPKAHVEVDTDMLSAARALAGREPGVIANLGTGSFSLYYDGTQIVDARPGIGYILGDEGSGADLGRKVVQHFLYETFDEDLMSAFRQRYSTDRNEILNKVYKQPLANRYLASFALFLAENRGHYMVENILEDSFNDFFFQHLCKYKAIWEIPVSFAGSISYGFQDVLRQCCYNYGFEMGQVLKSPMDGLKQYHQEL